MAEVLTPTTTSTHQAANLAPVTARPTALSPSAPPSPRQHPPAPTPEPAEQPGPAARGHFPSTKHTRTAALLGLALGLLAVAGCGQQRVANSTASAAATSSAKAEFTRAADRICTAHLETIIAWLGQPHAGNTWQRSAAQDHGTYRIIDNTIRRLEALGPPPGPNAAAFARYLNTLKARDALYRLASIADQQREKPYTERLRHRVDKIDPIGNQDAHQYGLHICGATAHDLAKALQPTRSLAE
jgi:hypothetical protein